MKATFKVRDNLFFDTNQDMLKTDMERLFLSLLLKKESELEIGIMLRVTLDNYLKRNVKANDGNALPHRICEYWLDKTREIFSKEYIKNEGRDELLRKHILCAKKWCDEFEKHDLPLLISEEEKRKLFFDYAKPGTYIPSQHPDVPQVLTSSVSKVYEVLEFFFEAHQRDELKHILKTGNTPISPLLFKGTSKTLLHFFKLLYEGKHLTVPFKKDLEKWVVNSFSYMSPKGECRIDISYAQDVISGSIEPAIGKRLIKIQDGTNEIIVLPFAIRKKESK